jgi:hypothetical protein
MQTITTIGLDIAKSVFRFMASMRTVMWLSAVSLQTDRDGDRLARSRITCEK